VLAFAIHTRRTRLAQAQDVVECGPAMALVSVAKIAGGRAVIVIIFAALVFVLYTRRGSGISQRPVGHEKGDAPGVAEGSSPMSASDEEVDDSVARQRPH
jgi:hypothetical protein